jgi:hypothetical protein
MRLRVTASLRPRSRHLHLRSAAPRRRSGRAGDRARWARSQDSVAGAPARDPASLGREGDEQPAAIDQPGRDQGAAQSSDHHLAQADEGRGRAEHARRAPPCRAATGHGRNEGETPSIARELVSKWPRTIRKSAPSRSSAAAAPAAPCTAPPTTKGRRTKPSVAPTSLSTSTSDLRRMQEEAHRRSDHAHHRAEHDDSEAERSPSRRRRARTRGAPSTLVRLDASPRTGARAA